MAAVLLVACACAFRVIFFASLGEGIPYLLYFPALTLAALFGGLVAGLLATALSASVVLFWIHQGHLAPPEWLGLLIFIISGALISHICELMHGVLRQERLARNEAETMSQQLRQEIIARQRAEEVRVRLAAIIESSEDAIIGKDLNGAVTSWNKSAEKMFGYTAGEMIGTSIQRLVPADYQVEEEQIMAQVRRGESVQHFDTTRLTKEGRRLAVSIAVSPIRDSAGKIIGMSKSARDLTERRRLDKALADSELRYRRLFEAARDGVLILDAETGLVVDVNPYLIELLGVTREVFLGKKVWELGFFKDLIVNEANFAELQAKQYLRYEDMALEGFDGKRHEVEFVSNVYLVDGHKVIQCNIRDISERVKASAEALQNAVILEQKHAELERFLYSTSHDLKSPVVTVRTFIGYLEQDLAAADAGKIAKDIKFIRDAADKLWSLLNNVLAVGKIGHVVAPPEPVTFRQLADDALAAVAGQIAKGGVTVRVGDGELALFGDRVRLSEVFQNLLDNACKFMSGQPAPRIEIGFEGRGAATVFFVRDNGIGLDPRHQAKLFGLFEKMDPKTEGTGIGLAISKRIVELNQGRIWAESAGLGQGAGFYFTLPGAVGTGGRIQNSEARRGE